MQNLSIEKKILENTAISESSGYSGDSTRFPFHVALTSDTKQKSYSDRLFREGDRPTVLLFWLTTCVPCGRELEAIKSNYAHWQTQVPFHLVAISEDWEENYPAFVQRLAKENWPFKAYWDQNREFKPLLPGRLNGLPQTFIFDKKGNISFSKKGFVPGDEHILFEKIKEAAQS